MSLTQESWRAPVGCHAILVNYQSDPIHHHKALLNIVWDKWSFIVMGTMDKFWLNKIAYSWIKNFHKGFAIIAFHWKTEKSS